METKERAELIAEILVRDQGVRRVELFGSVAKFGRGNDIDMVLISNRETSERFMSLMKTSGSLYAARGGSAGLRTRMQQVEAFKARRRKAAVEALGEEFRRLFAQAGHITRVEKIDLFVLPPDWKTNSDVGRRYSQDDPKFLMRIAPEAIVIA